MNGEFDYRLVARLRAAFTAVVALVPPTIGIVALGLLATGCSDDEEEESSGSAVTTDSSTPSGSSEDTTTETETGLAISSYSHLALPSAGGALFVVRGTGFGSSASVQIGGAECQVTTSADTEITCVSPSGSGSADLAVTGDDDESEEVADAVTFMESAENVKEVASGLAHTCALLANGETYCWGDNTSGQLGDNTGTSSRTPVKVSGLGAARSVSAGAYHTCALLTDGSVSCWGANASGQLGNGTTTSSGAPVGVTSVSGARALSSGGYHNCVIGSGGTVSCWGENSSGQLGNASTTDSSSAVALSVSLGAVDIAAGGEHSCAVVASGAVYCWGKGASGQLGNQSTSDSSSAGLVKISDGSNLSHAKKVTAGEAHACALASDGALYCWGDNSGGQLGDGSTTARAYATTAASTMSAVAVSAGGYHSCAIGADGAVHCWGKGTSGELGNGGQADSAAAAQANVSVARQLDGGFGHTCSVTTAGTVECWGMNDYGQLGNGAAESADLAPSALLAGDAASDTLPIQIAAGMGHACAVMSDGSVRCWGRNTYGELGDNSATQSASPVEVSGLSGATQVVAGGYHSCARLGTGEAKCWGLNTSGQLGDNTVTSSAYPVGVKSADEGGTMHEITELGAGHAHSCALTQGGNAFCWGSGSVGQLGYSSSNASYPIAVAVRDTDGTDQLGYLASISLGRYHGCAVSTGSYGSAYCWGYNAYAQLGNNSTTDSSFPVSVADSSGSGSLAAVVQVSAGAYHSCAQLSDGKLDCWGNNYSGQVGSSSLVTGSGAKRGYPIEVDSVSGVLAVAAGSDASCAALTDGSAKCWGANDDGQLGNGSTSTSADSSAESVGSLEDVFALASGEDASCAVSGAGVASCWGDGAYGQLGNGAESDSSSPVSVAW